MELVCKVAAVCLIGAVLAVLVKKGSPDFALLLVLAAAVVVLWWLREVWLETAEFLHQLLGASNLAPELFQPLLKTVAIALVCRVGSGICRDAGQEALASLVEIAAAFSAIWVTLPLLAAVWEMLQEML